MVIQVCQHHLLKSLFPQLTFILSRISSALGAISGFSILFRDLSVFREQYHPLLITEPAFTFPLFLIFQDFPACSCFILLNLLYIQLKDIPLKSSQYCFFSRLMTSVSLFVTSNSLLSRLRAVLQNLSEHCIQEQKQEGFFRSASFLTTFQDHVTHSPQHSKPFKFLGSLSFLPLPDCISSFQLWQGVHSRPLPCPCPCRQLWSWRCGKYMYRFLKKYLTACNVYLQAAKDLGR